MASADFATYCVSACPSKRVHSILHFTATAGQCTVGQHFGILPRMHSGDLTREQAERLHARIYPAFSYLADLQKRMDERGFSPSDRLYQEVQAARSTMHLLVDHLHRSRCGPSYGGKRCP
jgi:hypothetical protein